MKINKVLLTTLICLSAAVANAQSPVSELSFYAKQAQTDNKKVLEAIQQHVSVWLQRNPTLPQADEGSFLNVDLLVRLGLKPQAQLATLKYMYEYPSGKYIDTARALLPNEGAKLESAKRQDYLKAGTQAPTSAAMPPAERLVAYLGRATTLNLRNSYSALMDDYQDFAIRYPFYENMDRIELMLGDLHRQNKNYQSAVMQYRKVYEIYPSSRYKAAALRMMGDIYAGELKNPSVAMDYYNKVLQDYPTSIEVGTTYFHMALLSESHRDYEGAAKYANSAAAAYLDADKKPEAYDALRLRAQVQEKRLKNYTAAIETLTHAAEIFKDDEAKYIEVEFEIARVNGAKLKDKHSELKAYQAIAAAYPRNARTAEALYKAGQINESFGKEAEAKTFYKRLIVTHPADAYAKRAQMRIDSIERAQRRELARAVVEGRATAVMNPVQPVPVNPGLAPKPVGDGPVQAVTLPAVAGEFEPVIAPEMLPEERALQMEIID